MKIETLNQANDLQHRIQRLIEMQKALIDFINSLPGASPAEKGTGVDIVKTGFHVAICDLKEKFEKL